MIVLRSPSVAGAVIRSEAFLQYRMADQYRELKRRTGLDFGATIQFMDYLPLFADGEEHLKRRRMMARKLAATRNLQEEAVTAKISWLFQNLFVPPRELELLTEFARPLWREISASIVDRSEENLDFIDELPSLFYPTLSIRERMKINEKLRTFLDVNRSNIDEALCNLSLALLGARPFVGSLVHSVYQVVTLNAGKKSSAIRWPEIFTDSSLNFVDRVCGHDTRIDAHEFNVGSRVRCYTQDESYSAQQNKEMLFGLGAHACLGKGISEFSWKLLIRHLAQLDAILVPLGREVSTNTEPFVMPLAARIAVR